MVGEGEKDYSSEELDFRMKVTIFSGLHFLIQYDYYIEGHKWDDSKNFHRIIQKGHGATPISKWEPYYYPLVLE